MGTETIREFEIEFGNGDFLSIAHKRAKADPDDPAEFIAIGRGYMDVQGQKRYKSTIHVPYSPHLISWLLIGLDITRHDGEIAVPKDTEALVVSRETAEVALRELGYLIDRAELDTLTDDVFEAHDELEARLQPDKDEGDS